MKNTKTYVITGATSGIGLALLKELSKDNLVFAGYRDNNKIKDINFNTNIIPFFIDMTDSETIKKASEFIKSKVLKIDTLINGAGCVVAGAIETIDIKDIKRQFEVNTFSHLEFTQQLFSLLDGGKVINISSMASYGIFPFISPYCASKRAMDILFNAMQIECKNNIKCISIQPGAIATPLWSKSIETNKKNLLNDKYKNEYDYLIQNAYNNEKKGLNVNKVVSVILKADKAKNPKCTYTVGTDAFFAKLISHLPQNLLNNIIKTGLQLRLKGRKNDKQS